MDCVQTDTAFTAQGARYAIGKKGSARAQAHIIYYLKKSVIIPKREFWYLTDDEVQSIMNEIASKV